MKIRKTAAETPALLPEQTDPELGLTGAQVQLRLEGGFAAGDAPGVNKTNKEIILAQCFTFFNLIFLIMGLLLLAAGSSVLNMGFLLVALINTVIGIVQQLRAKAALDKLTLLAQRPVTVIREGKREQLPPAFLVRDDIVIPEPGDTVPGDGILCTGEFQVDESLITGEAEPVMKKSGDRLVSGSVIISGFGKMRLTAVGEACFAARLAAQAKANPTPGKSEMMRSLDKLIRFIGILLIPVGMVLFAQEFWILKLSLRHSTEGTVAALVGMIPEGLYLLTSIALAVSALKLSRRRVLVQDMACIESLARVDILCVDKTGTITEPSVEVHELVSLGDASPEELEEILAALFSGFPADNDTARAMQELYGRESAWKCEKRIPFSPVSKWSGGIFEGHGAYLAGAPEFILGERYDSLRPVAEPWTEEGYRVLLIAAYGGQPVPGGLDASLVTPLALVLLNSRLRADAVETFRYFEKQGVSIRVLSGDDPRTAAMIAAKAGIDGAERYLDASELLEEEDYRRAVKDTVVFGRVTPEQKKKLIAALQDRGHTVAMTGDGVNDLLAMKQADCSVAMASGARSAGQVASVVLLDSNFSAMPGIVAEGRRVINNIQRSAALFLVKNIFSLTMALVCLLTGWAYPLIPIHLTVVAALTIGVPSFFLALEPNYDRVRGKFLPNVLRRALPGGLSDLILVCIGMALGQALEFTPAQTATVCATALAAVGMLVLVGVCRPFHKFRIVLCAVLGAALVGAFTLLGGILGFAAGSTLSKLVLLTMLIMAPTVYLAMAWLFSVTDRLLDPVKRKLRGRKKN